MLCKIKRAVLAAAVISLVSAVALASETPTANTSAPTIENLQQQLEAMQQQMHVLMSQIKTLQTQQAKTAEDTDYTVEEVEDLDDRLTLPEKHSVLDAISFSGDFRVEAHVISADTPDHFDGIKVQNGLVNSLFVADSMGGLPPLPPNITPESYEQFVNQYIRDNYSNYQYFLANTLDFNYLKQAVGSFPPELQQQLFGLILPTAYRPGYNADNDQLYTSRLRLRMHAEVDDSVTFDGRLGMYKVWGDSTGVQVFNGQPTSISWDGTTTNVPNSDILRVERAYFTWKDIAGLPVYASIGRRPSTGGTPLNFRQDEPRGGTPAGLLVDYQYDGITLGWHINDTSTLRFCAGVGYESGWGNASILQTPGDRLDDATLAGLLWDIVDTDNMFIQATYAMANNVTDGFNALTVLPFDPVSGQTGLPPAVIRFSPSANVGDIDLASLVMARHDGPFDYFLSGGWSSTDPNPVTTPFGGLLSDPFDVPRSHDGYMYYLGARYAFNEGATKFGVEFNHGTKYWFNFSLAEDDIIGPKTSVRGDVFEAYLTHRIRDHFVAKLAYIDYAYDYSGSGWLLGAPKALNEMPILPTPTYKNASKFMLSLSARFW
jgi:hypothetical protein